MRTRAAPGRQDKPLWRPDRARIDAAPITRFAAYVADRHGLVFPDYESLWRWSVDELEQFWTDVVAFFDVRFQSPARVVLSRRSMPGARWFEGATLNYAAHLLRRADAADALMRPALLFRNESGLELATSWRELADQTGSVAECLRRLGVVPGDRVAAYSPNIRETAAALLATAACGAVWSSCAPDLGATSVLDRFRLIGPKVLFAVDGYRYGGKAFDRARSWPNWSPSCRPSRRWSSSTISIPMARRTASSRSAMAFGRCHGPRRPRRRNRRASFRARRDL